MIVHRDHLGTPRRLTNETGEIVWKWAGDVFGTDLAQADFDGDGYPVEFNMRFPGQYYDYESGLHYNWNRYYDPQMGRYITSDPIGLEGGINTYGYAMQNPTAYFDYNGLAAALCLAPGINAVCITAGQHAINLVAVGLGVSMLGGNDNVIDFPSRDEPEICEPDDPCQEWHDELALIYLEIVTGSIPAADLEKRVYNNSVDLYHKECHGYPRLPKFEI